MANVAAGFTASSAGSSTGVNARRALEHSADLSLYVDDVERAVGLLSQIAATSGGDVVSLDDERPSSERDSRVAKMKVDVPSLRFDDALGRTAHLGVVRSRTVDAEDVGNELIDDAARLRNLRRTERDISKIMDRSGRISEVLDAQSELSSVREETEKFASERAALEHRVTYASLEVRFEGAVVPPVTQPTVATRLAEARRDALQRFVDTFVLLATVSLKILAVVPFAAAAAIVLVVVFNLARRRRRATSSSA